MPFKSEAQRRFMYASHPRIARRWQKKMGGRDLPERVGGKKRIAPRFKRNRHWSNDRAR